jgi:hypothetical protein
MLCARLEAVWKEVYLVFIDGDVIGCGCAVDSAAAKCIRIKWYYDTRCLFPSLAIGRYETWTGSEHTPGDKLSRTVNGGYQLSQRKPNHLEMPATPYCLLAMLHLFGSLHPLLLQYYNTRDKKYEARAIPCQDSTR